VIAAHECKSTVAFPELYAGFLGLALLTVGWMKPNSNQEFKGKRWHLAPTLFVGGTANQVGSNMTKALSRLYPINVITGLHREITLLGRDCVRIPVPTRAMNKRSERTKPPSEDSEE